MPTFGDKLADDEIWAVIAYLMSLSAPDKGRGQSP
jgi:mono/diheme cytochrome c family protein